MLRPCSSFVQFRFYEAKPCITITTVIRGHEMNKYPLAIWYRFPFNSKRVTSMTFIRFHGTASICGFIFMTFQAFFAPSFPVQPCSRVVIIFLSLWAAASD